MYTKLYNFIYLMAIFSLIITTCLLFLGANIVYCMNTLYWTLAIVILTIIVEIIDNWANKN